ncbi:recombinase family protein [Sphingobium sp. AN641]|uniref:recombinase family protein n=1 Tax=Sphingobium sp. AN641 TaxID=3133443 RepID=UPI0030BCE92D
MLIGYARTSTVDQVAGLEAQEAALAATGCTKIVKEQASSVGAARRLGHGAGPFDKLRSAFVREGDTLVVSRLDRLARSTADQPGSILGHQHPQLH